MKLDKIRFASLIGFISCRYALTVTQDDMREIDEIIDIDVPVADVAYPANNDIDMLMFLMSQGTQKIEAIKVHRKLTGMGLKDSKDAIEKYWRGKTINEAVPGNLGDILRTVSKD